MSDTKAYRTVPDGRLIKIEWEGGGEIPKQLQGRYTSHKEALKAIQNYEDTRPDYRKAKREVKNDTDKGSTRA